jgi:hypothetical protein
MAAARTTFALLAIGLGVGACGALQGLDKFDKCDTDEECGLLGGGGTDGPISSQDGPSSNDGAVEAGCGDVMTDPNNCGRCGNACGTGFACSGGTCTCSKTTCGGPNADGGADGGDASAEAGTGGPLSCVDVTTDPKHCGGCGVACSFPNAVAKCVASQCGVASCAAGFVDCDGNTANGCECASDSCLTAQKLCAKRVFTTSVRYDGNLGGLAGADAKCQARAVAASLPGTYKAWLSDATGSPSTRFTKSTIPYRTVDGTLIANDYADLTDGTLAAPPDKTETGGAPPRTTFCGPMGAIPDRIMVWASTAANGTLQASQGTCTNWTDPAEPKGAQWADPSSSSMVPSCSGGACGGPTFMAPIFCFQQ